MNFGVQSTTILYPQYEVSYDVGWGFMNFAFMYDVILASSVSNILISKDTVPWPLHICTCIK